MPRHRRRIAADRLENVGKRRAAGGDALGRRCRCALTRHGKRREPRRGRQAWRIERRAGGLRRQGEWEIRGDERHRRAGFGRQRHGAIHRYEIGAAVRDRPREIQQGRRLRHHRLTVIRCGDRQFGDGRRDGDRCRTRARRIAPRRDRTRALAFGAPRLGIGSGSGAIDGAVEGVRGLTIQPWLAAETADRRSPGRAHRGSPRRPHRTSPQRPVQFPARLD